MAYKVSVIVPVYNGIKYLKECMDSILHQSLSEIEIVCVDDGSTDGTAELLDNYVVQDDRVKVIHKPNSGYGHSMNVGIAYASGEYIGIVEADDYIDQKMYESLYEYAKVHDADIVKADYYTFLGEGDNRRFLYSALFSENNAEWYGVELNYKKSYKVFEAYMVSWAGIYKRNYLIENKIKHNETPGASYQDNGFWIQNMIYGKRIFFLNQPFYYLRRDNEESSIYNRGKVFCMCDEYDFMRQCILKRNIDCEKLLNFLWKRRFGAYKAELLRIAYEHKQSFLQRFSKDFQFAIENGEVKKEDLSESQWKEIQEIIFDFDNYFEKYYKIGKMAWEKLENAEYIAIYGAKGNGVRAIGDVQTTGHRKKLLGVVVTDTANNSASVRNIPVSAFKNIDYPKETLFIIATHERHQEEIKQELEQKGYVNIMKYQDMRE